MCVGGVMVISGWFGHGGGAMLINGWLEKCSGGEDGRSGPEHVFNVIIIFIFPDVCRNAGSCISNHPPLQMDLIAILCLKTAHNTTMEKMILHIATLFAIKYKHVAASRTSKKYPGHYYKYKYGVNNYATTIWIINL